LALERLPFDPCPAILNPHLKGLPSVFPGPLFFLQQQERR
jgi:hypothetical protein